MKEQLMQNKMELMMRCYNDHPPQERTKNINNEPKHTLGAKIKK